MNERWPFNVDVLPDEIFSSWLSRVALEHSCDPITLTGFLWPDWRPWMTDIDRGVGDDRLASLCEGLNIDSRNLHRTFLQNLADQIGQTREYGVCEWITTIGSRNRKRISGLQCCPRCLSNDSIPYFRKHWRYAWHCCCEEHKVRLINSCHSCNAQIMPHLVTVEIKSLRFCSNCLGDLTDINDIHISDYEVSRQKIIDGFVTRHSGYIGQDKIEIKEWFLTLKLMINLLCRRLNKNYLSMFALRNELTFSDRSRSENEFGIPFEAMGPIHRAKLINQAWPIFEMDLDEIIRIFKKHKISTNSVKELVSKVPKAFEVLTKNNYKKHSPKVLSPMYFHQSKRQVLKAYKKLIRRNKCKLIVMIDDEQ